MKQELKKITTKILNNSKALCIIFVILSVSSILGIGILDIPQVDYSFALDDLTYTLYNLYSMVFFFSVIFASFFGGYHVGKPKLSENL